MKVKMTFYFVVFLMQIGFAQNSNEFFNAIRHNDVELVQKAIQNDKTIINKKNEQGFTPLILASYYHRIKIAKLLLNNNASINIKSDMGTALMAATYKGDEQMVALLLQHNANPNIFDDKGTSALHLACTFNKPNIIKLLLAHKAVKNSKDAQGKTPLDYAISNNNIEIIKLFEHE